jgi:hypothetical protein
MAAGEVTTGRRVFSIDELELAGDYFYELEVDQNGDRSLWFVLPTATSAHHHDEDGTYIPHNGRHRVASPSWTITENADGSLSAQPSIACGLPVYWHGYLDEGHRWREV